MAGERASDRSSEMVSCAVVGASGAVGEELLKVLGELKDDLGVESVRLFASQRSAGKTLVNNEFGEVEIEEYSLDKLEGVDYAFLAVSGDFAKEHAKAIAGLGAVVIDNSSAFRYDNDVPLVVPEINGHTAVGKNLIANPNCTTAIAAMALWPLHKQFEIKKLIVSTYQASSGAGAEGMAELEQQAAAYNNNEALEAKVFAYPLLFNVIPHIDQFQENGYTREEMKVTWETRKIFGVPDLAISCTCVRIPTLRAHAEALTIETAKPITPAEAKEIISKAEGVTLVDDPENKKYPMPLTASAKNDVECGRIRSNPVFGDKGLDLFVCGDQLLRGAALNAVLIAIHLEAAKANKRRKVE